MPLSQTPSPSSRSDTGLESTSLYVRIVAALESIANSLASVTQSLHAQSEAIAAYTRQKGGPKVVRIAQANYSRQKEERPSAAESVPGFRIPPSGP